MIAGLLLAPLCGLSALVADCSTVDAPHFQRMGQSATVTMTMPHLITSEPNTHSSATGAGPSAARITVSVEMVGTEGSNRSDGTAPCQVFWGNAPVTGLELLRLGQDQLLASITEIGGVRNLTEENFPTIQMHGDPSTPYRCIGGVAYLLQFAGFQQIEFVSPPRSEPVNLYLLAPPPEDNATIPNRIFIADSDVVHWNNVPISYAQLTKNIDFIKSDQLMPRLLIEPAANSHYGVFIDVLNVVSRSGIGNPGLVGNERYARDF